MLSICAERGIFQALVGRTWNPLQPSSAVLIWAWDREKLVSFSHAERSSVSYWSTAFIDRSWSQRPVFANLLENARCVSLMSSSQSVLKNPKNVTFFEPDNRALPTFNNTDWDDLIIEIFRIFSWGYHFPDVRLCDWRWKLVKSCPQNGTFWRHALPCCELKRVVIGTTALSSKIAQFSQILSKKLAPADRSVCFTSEDLSCWTHPEFWSGRSG